MKDLNSVNIVGRLTREAELKYTNGGLPIVRFSIAVNRPKKSGDGNFHDEASFFDVVKIGAGSEGLAQYLTKGTRVAIQGELRQDRWEKDGQARSKVEIDAFLVQLLGSPQDRNSAPPPAESGQKVQRDPMGKAYEAEDLPPF